MAAFQGFRSLYEYGPSKQTIPAVHCSVTIPGRVVSISPPSPSERFTSRSPFSGYRKKSPLALKDRPRHNINK
jgi:hypothetical protein